MELSCPLCGNQQRESGLVQSTNCRKCHAYLKVVDGKATAPGQQAHPEHQPTPTTSREELVEKISKRVVTKSPTEPAPVTGTPIPTTSTNTPPRANKTTVNQAPANQSPPKGTPVKKAPATPAKKATPKDQQKVKAQPKSQTPATKQGKKKAEKGAEKKLSPIPTSDQPTHQKPAKKAATKQVATPPFPKESAPKDQRPTASVPQTTRNPLPKKPVKPKAPPPPAKKTAAVANQAATNTPSSEPQRFRPPTSNNAEPAKPGIAPLINREKKRSVKCFDCAESHEILADSRSAMCPHCGAYIGLKDFDIREQENSRVQTRGNVFVHKKGYVSGITIQAHNLTIEGEIQGGAECTGDFVVRKTGKINGPVTSDRVIIERRAKVDFLSTVQAREVIINGHVTGSVSCKKLTLQKKATLDGDLTVASLSVEEGAKHTGQIKMTPLL